MKIKITTLFLLMLLIPILSSAEFKLVPADKEYSDKDNMHIGMRYANFAPNKIFSKVPTEIKDYQSTKIEIDKDNSFNIAAFNNKAINDGIIIDMNNDNDLTNDKKITIGAGSVENINSQTINFKLKNGKKVDVMCVFYQWGVSFKTLQWYKGNVQIGDKKINAVLIDGMNAGIALNANDYLLLDVNNDGKFEFKSQNLMSNSESFFIVDNMNIQGKLYTVQVDSSKPDISIKQFAGKSGKIKIDLEFQKPLKNPTYSLSFVIADKNIYYPASFKSEQMPYEIVSNKYTLSGIIIFDAQTTGTKKYIQFKYTEPVKISDEGITALKIGKHNPYELTIAEDERGLTVGQKLSGPNNLEYSSLYSIENKNGKENYNAVSPEVKVYNADKKLLSEGPMQYG